MPKQLNIEELLYAATLTNDPAKQEAIFTKATKLPERLPCLQQLR